MAGKNRIVAAVDIGTTKVVATAGYKDEFGKITIIGYGQAESKGVVRGTVQNVGDVANAVKTAVDKCKASAGTDFKDVFVGIAGQNIREQIYTHSKFMGEEGGLITQADLDQITDEVYSMSKEPGEEIIHVIPQFYEVDGQNTGLRAVGWTGKKISGHFYVALGKATSVQNIRQAVNLTGLNVVRIFLEPLAAAEAVLSEEEKEAGVVVADLGGGTTDIAVFQKKVLCGTSFVPFGGTSVTKDICTACQISQKQAEMLKIKHGCAFPPLDATRRNVAVINAFGSKKEISFSDLGGIINARLDEILGGIAYNISSPQYDKDKLLAGIVITGGTASLKEIMTLTKYRLGITARPGMVKNVITGKFSDLNDPKYSVSAGLLIKGQEYFDKLEDAAKRKKAAMEAAQKEIQEASGSKAAANQPYGKKDNVKKTATSFWGKIKKIASDFLEDGTDEKDV